LSLRHVCIFEIYIKRQIFYTQHAYFEKKILDPYKVKPNLTLPEQSFASTWILDLELKKKILSFPGPPPTSYTPSFFISKKSLKFDGGYYISVKTDFFQNLVLIYLKRRILRRFKKFNLVTKCT
jgi:hypothetical protein